MFWTVRRTSSAFILFVLAASGAPPVSFGQEHETHASLNNSVVKHYLWARLADLASGPAEPRLQKKTLHYWSNHTWNPGPQSTYVYGKFGRIETWHYDYDWNLRTWVPTLIYKTNDDGSGYMETLEGVFENSGWNFFARTQTDYRIEETSGHRQIDASLVQSLYLTDWVDRERAAYTYSPSHTISGGKFETFDGTAWLPEARFTVTEEGGDVIIQEQVPHGDTWRNVVRTIYPEWNLAALQFQLAAVEREIKDFEGMLYGVHLLPDIVVESWDGTKWVGSHRQRRVEDPSTGDVVEVVSENWQDGAWMGTGRYVVTYFAPGIVESISSETPADTGWRAFFLETHARDGDTGTLIVTQRKLDEREQLVYDRKYVMEWNHLATAAEIPLLAELYSLDPAFPNPFNPTTRLSYRLSTAAEVNVSVYDVLGRRVRLLVNSIYPAGRHEVVFDGGDLPSGRYIVRLDVPGFTQSRFVTLSK